MKLVQLLHCKNDLNFHPLRSWPKELPAVVWNGQVIAGFSNTFGVEVEGKLSSALRAAYSELSLAELARLWQCLKTVGLQDEMSTIAEIYGLRFSERLEQTMVAVAALPMEIQNWLGERKVSARELAGLLTPKISNTGLIVFSRLRELRASRSQVAQVLELCIELELMGITDWRLPAESIEAWLRNLENLRHPVTQNLDKALADKWNGLGWPQNFKHEVVRKGDLASIDVKFSIQSDRQLQNAIENLERIREQANEQDIWKSAPPLH